LKKIALISVSDKTGIVDFAGSLIEHNYKILATGNTAKLIAENGIECTEIRDFTKFPEIFSGRVKTLQPKIFGGILMRRDNESDVKEAEENNILPIDVVCVNLYPFPKVVNRTDIDLQTKIENIDIGGPSLIRAAAKNYKYVSVLTNPTQYKEFIEKLSGDGISKSIREKLASEAFSHTAKYDTLIANFFEKEFDTDESSLRINELLISELRYGENPHQHASLYGNFYKYFEVLHGKELSYNNIIDFSAAVELVNDLEPNSCAVIKHTNPCGAATSDSIFNAYRQALSSDPVSAFGGIVAFNGKVELDTAEKLNEIFLEIIAAPEYSDEALELLKKKKNRRLVKMSKQVSAGLQVKSVPGGFVAQNLDTSQLSDDKLKIVTNKKCSDKDLEDLKFAWVICKHTKSNAIVYAKDKKILGVGAGQMSRIDSSKIASMKAGEHGHNLEGAVAASDAFFPFADGLKEIISNGIVSVIQPGGSVRDSEVIDEANKNNISMIFTGIRNFKH
jgi:phosphoribosylaminoimidazolecarboxamide formyltransferase/IMP cyclohydrolase